MVAEQQKKQGGVIEDRGWQKDVASLVGVVRKINEKTTFS